MKFQKVSGGKGYRPWKNWTEGDTFVGRYIKTSEDNYGNDNYEFETIEAEFDDGKEPKAGSLFVLNSCGSINKSFEENDIEKGQVLKVVYTGEITLAKGKYAGKKAHTCEVYLAESSSISEQVDDVL